MPMCVPTSWHLQHLEPAVAAAKELSGNLVCCAMRCIHCKALHPRSAGRALQQLQDPHFDLRHACVAGSSALSVRA